MLMLRRVYEMVLDKTVTKKCVVTRLVSIIGIIIISIPIRICRRVTEILIRFFSELPAYSHLRTNIITNERQKSNGLECVRGIASADPGYAMQNTFVSIRLMRVAVPSYELSSRPPFSKLE